MNVEAGEILVHLKLQGLRRRSDVMKYTGGRGPKPTGGLGDSRIVVALASVYSGFIVIHAETTSSRKASQIDSRDGLPPQIISDEHGRGRYF